MNSSSFSTVNPATGEQIETFPFITSPALTLFPLRRGTGATLPASTILRIKKAAVEAWSKSKPTVLEVPISRQVPPLI